MEMDMHCSLFKTLAAAFAIAAAASGYATAQNIARMDPSPLANPAYFQDNKAIDPFLAGALGLIPFSSGLYLGPEPAQGFVFTLLDIVLVAGAWNALNSRTGDPDNAPLFMYAMAMNNAVDAYLSVRKSLHTQKVRITPVTYDRNGRVSSIVTVRF
jgi:hypothetical protein